LKLLLAFLAIPLAAGGIAGLIDGIASFGTPGGERSLAVLILAPSLGALLATVPLLLVAAPAFAFGQRRPESLLAASVSALILLAPAFVLFRLLYKRLPWSPAETAGALAAGLTLALVLATLTRVGAKVWGAKGTKAASVLARCAPFLF
jgi:hypothetical protein